MSRAGIIMEAETATSQTTRHKSPQGQLTGYTMCPNWIYDSLLIEENPSVVKVVLYFNRNTTGRTSTSGERVEFKQATYGLIASRMNMSVRAVGEAVRTALAKGYLVQRKVEHTTRASAFEGDFYALNWNWPLKVMPNTSDASIDGKISPIQSVNSLTLNTSRSGGNLKFEVGQNLPGDDRQNLPACINKANKSKINQKFELESVRIFEMPESDAVTTTANSTDMLDKLEKSFDSSEQKSLECRTKTGRKRRGSSAVGQLITDLTREFGDKSELILPNITRALNLWRETNLTERDFLDRIYLARKKTLACPLIFNRRQALPGESASGLPNRMPYFFSVLAEMVETVEAVPQAPALPSISAVKAKPTYIIEESPTVSRTRPQTETPAPFESDPEIIRQKVGETLQQRFRNLQLAEKASNLEFFLNTPEKQVVISSATSPWLVKSLLSSEVALLQLAVTSQIGEGYTLSLS